MSEPFIFPSQVTQVFFSSDLRKPSWKVVLRKEQHSRKEVADMENVFITTTMEAGGLTTSVGLPTPLSTTSLIGAIELSDENNLIASAQF
jgi:hypothetical protein